MFLLFCRTNNDDVLSLADARASPSAAGQHDENVAPTATEGGGVKRTSQRVRQKKDNLALNHCRGGSIRMVE